MCEGTGKITCPHMRRKNMAEKRQIAQDLRNKGYSFREIQKHMKYKHVGSVQNLLKNK